MASVSFDASEFDGLIQRAVAAAVREVEERWPRDEAGKILLKKREAAQAMGVDERTIDRWRDEHGLPFIKPAGKVLFSPESLRDWAKKRETSLANGG